MNTIAATLLGRIRAEAPLVHNITNYVVMNSSANILLAAGAAPVMAHAPEEAAEMAGLAGSLVLNIGTLSTPWIEAMLLAGMAANGKGIPIILDPVGSGATRFRTTTVRRLQRELRPAVLRGNASEIASLTGVAATTRGVDAADAISPELAAAAQAFARREGCVVGISGPIDLVTDGQRGFRIRNGHPLMTRVTGLGCGLSAITGAFCAVAQDIPLVEAVAAAFGFYGVCGEIAAAQAQAPGSFQTAFIDTLFTLSADTLIERLAISEAPLA
jgi:hydroxyethylthiazole kinase